MDVHARGNSRVETKFQCRRSLYAGAERYGRAAERSLFNVRQSAKQLDVQKNILLNGFDSSTEDEHKFKPLTHKIFLAPLPVKR